MRGGAIEDYTYMWWDVRPHPNFGTVETRVFDQQTTLDHTVALAALTIALAHHMSAFYDDERPLVESPTELIDDNKVRAAVGGMDGRLIDFWRGEQVPAEEMARGLLDVLADDAAELGCTAELELVEDLLGGNTGAHRQLRFWKLGTRTSPGWSARSPPTLARRGRWLCSPRAWRKWLILEGAMAETELSVVCKNCGAEVSPYVTECPYCGTRLRKRAPKLERRGDELQARETRSDRRAAGARRAPAPRSAAGLRLRPPVRHPGGDPGPRRAAGGPARRRPQPHGLGVISAGVGSTEWWRYFAAPFVYDDLGYLFAIGAGDGAVRPLPRAASRRGADADPAHRLRGARRAGGTGPGRGPGRRLHADGRRQRDRAGRARRLVVLHRADARDDPTEEYDWIAVAVAASVLLLLPLVEDLANPWAGIVGGLVRAGRCGFSATLGRR